MSQVDEKELDGIRNDILGFQSDNKIHLNSPNELTDEQTDILNDILNMYSVRILNIFIEEQNQLEEKSINRHVFDDIMLYESERNLQNIRSGSDDIRQINIESNDENNDESNDDMTGGALSQHPLLKGTIYCNCNCPESRMKKRMSSLTPGFMNPSL